MRQLIKFRQQMFKQEINYLSIDINHWYSGFSQQNKRQVYLATAGLALPFD